MITKELLKSQMENLFQYLKLDDKTADFYLFCLMNGKTTINKVSQDIGVARSTCYLILEKLKNLGLIIETPFGKKRSLIAQKPEEIIELLREEKEKTEKALNLAEEIIPQLNPYSKVDLGSKVRFYEGFDSIKQIYYETYEAKLICVICLTQNNDPDFRKFMDNYMKKLYQKRIETREIVSDAEHDLEYKNTYSSEINKIICIPKEYMSDTDYMLWNNKVAFVSYKNKRYTGVIIEDQEISQFEKNRFKLMWKMFAK